MKGRFMGLYARAFVHATESPERVKVAMANALGDAEIRVIETEGVHGNPLTILEMDLIDPSGVEALFSRLQKEDLSAIAATIDSRVDEGCNLFLKLDKQAAYGGHIRLGSGDDVISVRIRVAAFPAKQKIAEALVREAIDERLATGAHDAGAGD